MLEPDQCTPPPILRQVIGWVVVLPLLVSLARPPFPLGLGLALGAIAASVYGVVFARRHASRRVTVFALVATLLNAVSLVMLSTASVLMALYFIVRLYVYSYVSHWVYWNF
ncbi:hypothetical protein C4J93_1510 [Pseudomonas sp. R2-37-08W]|uniref:hypothetical protein n=1 Tax=unclassified Pseudomonas TaxID=196821 RepID=UPI000F57EEA2|nr:MULTISPECIES: hypothetical protein [unclassified Pseudomonas]AZF09724.1 hypothetical protein C4J93_1510 [Pseudomonas sp. R2-37-08W]AZF36151.1 hypothetical protein C4J88_1352 [Pseudomonas sp. R4-39-08]AZF51858.1 hypothetical protein C4J85_1357 [Pseudomonas sp. R4-34-07]